MYSCLTVCPTMPQKTMPLATPMDTVLAGGEGQRVRLSQQILFREDKSQGSLGGRRGVGDPARII